MQNPQMNVPGAEPRANEEPAAMYPYPPAAAAYPQAPYPYAPQQLQPAPQFQQRSRPIRRNTRSRTSIRRISRRSRSPIPIRRRSRRNRLSTPGSRSRWPSTPTAVRSRSRRPMPAYPMMAPQAPAAAYPQEAAAWLCASRRAASGFIAT